VGKKCHGIWRWTAGKRFPRKPIRIMRKVKVQNEQVEGVRQSRELVEGSNDREKRRENTGKTDGGEK
jgi:hypothetical protein